MLVRYRCCINKAGGIYPLATMVYKEMEEDVETVTPTVESMLQHSGDLHTIYEEEDELSAIAIALIHERTVRCHFDTNMVASVER